MQRVNIQDFLWDSMPYFLGFQKLAEISEMCNAKFLPRAEVVKLAGLDDLPEPFYDQSLLASLRIDKTDLESMLEKKLRQAIEGRGSIAYQDTTDIRRTQKVNALVQTRTDDNGRIDMILYDSLDRLPNGMAIFTPFIYIHTEFYRSKNDTRETLLYS